MYKSIIVVFLMLLVFFVLTMLLNIEKIILIVPPLLHKEQKRADLVVPRPLSLPSPLPLIPSSSPAPLRLFASTPSPAPAQAPPICHWVEMTYAWKYSSGHPSMCLQERSKDILSEVIHHYGRWPECDDLIQAVEGIGEDEIFVDVGANVGSCTLFIAGQGITTHAFEPQEFNLGYLRATLDRYPKLPVTLHEVAVGNGTLTASVMYRQNDNAGNSVVGVIHPDSPKDYDGMRRNVAVVRMSSLDEELWSHHRPPPIIALMKMDIQGYEVNALRGAKRLLEAGAIKRINMEIAPAFLNAHGNTMEELCAILTQAHFTLLDGFHGKPIIADCANWRAELYAVVY
jgi:FkbM family methyltransferase